MTSGKKGAGPLKATASAADKVARTEENKRRRATRHLKRMARMAARRERKEQVP